MKEPSILLPPPQLNLLIARTKAQLRFPIWPRMMEVPVGGLFWVQEDYFTAGGCTFYRYDSNLYTGSEVIFWREAHTMKREQSRITLVVTDRYTQYLHDMNEQELTWEGAEAWRFDMVEVKKVCKETGINNMRRLWDAAYGRGAYDKNPRAIVFSVCPNFRNIDVLKSTIEHIEPPRPQNW